MAEKKDGMRLDDREFEVIRKKVYEEIGVNLTEAKKPLTINRLSKRLRELNMNSFSEYYAHVESNPKELEIFFNRITTNVTKFFREPYHFERLQQSYLPNLVQKAKDNQTPKRIRAWSAGCSTGEEPYTLAIVLSEFFADKKGWDIKILASDINTDTLRKAEKGIYTAKEVKDIPYSLLTKYFKLGTGSNKGFMQAKDSLKKLISFKRVNLTDTSKYPLSAPLDFIFCRNVFIYFNKETQNKILRGYHNALKPGGLLFMGHSESINVKDGKAGNWHLLKHTVYERLS